MNRHLFPCLLAGVLLVTPARSQVLNDPALISETVVGGFLQPTHLEFFNPPSVDDFLVLEHRTGRVRRALGGTLTTVLDVHVNSSIDHGLLGLALHPDFATNGFAYVYYTESSTGADTAVATELLGNRIYRYTWNGATFDSPLLILDLPADPSQFHQGGLTIFGPDGKLYTTIGDQGRQGVLQNVSTGPGPDNTGSILRLEDDGSAPADNPLISVPGYEKIYAYGVRNVFGMDFDPLTGVMWQTENGPVDMDEINVVLPGFNSGWRKIMGPDARDPQGVGDLVLVPGAAYSDPEFSFLVSRGLSAIEFLETTNLGPEYENDILTADVVFNQVYHFELTAPRDALVLPPPLQDLVADDEAELADVIFGHSFQIVTDIETGPDGNVYLLEYSPGRILRVRHKTLDFLTDDAQLIVDCDVTGLTTVTGSYQVYGTGGDPVVASVLVEFYLDDPQVPANLLASFTDLNPSNRDDITHDFSFQWPDTDSHTVIMVVDRLDAHAEDLEANNQASWFEECLGFVVGVSETPFVAGDGVRLYQNAPNPFNPQTELRFELPDAGHATLTVYDLSGRVVAVLEDRFLPAGPHAHRWDGRDQSGRAVASGVYVARLAARGFEGAIRMVLAK